MNTLAADANGVELRTEPGAAAAIESVPGARLSIDNVWASAALAMAVFLGLLGPLYATDLAYHLRAGQAMLATHHLPGVDTFTFTVTGRSWVDQQWGAQVLLAVVYRIGGFSGLVMLRGVVVGASYGLLWLACRARGASRRTSSVLTVAGLLVGFLNTGMRPQTLAFPLFTGALWIVASRRAHPRRLWLLPALALVWANLHGSFLVLPIVIALAVAEDLRDRASTMRTTVVAGSLAIAATLANPFGAGAWRYAIGITTNGRILQQIVEWQPTGIRTMAGALFFLSALAVAGYLARRAAPTDPMLLAWLGAFFLIALPALRGVVWWGFVFPFALAALPEAGTVHEARTGNPVMNRLMIGLLAATVAVALPWWHTGIDPATGASSLLGAAPQGLVQQTVRRLPPGGHAFVAEPFASWFEFAAPAIPVFVDSRIELFPDRVWNDYLNVLEGREGWQAILDRWGVDAVVLQTDPSGLSTRIARDPRWRLAYRDPLGALYVRA